KHRNLLAHAPKKLHDEISADYTDMIYAKTVKDVEAKHKTFVRKWRLKCPGVVDSLEEAGARLFTFLRYPPEQWKSLRTTNAVERLHECDSAWNKDPVFGVIGIQPGPRGERVHNGFHEAHGALAR